MAETVEHEFLTARELAALLRVRERKVYELAASGEVPCSRATGKLLFRRTAVETWLVRSSSGPAPEAPRSAVFAGSHDPLLEWALRESGAALATYFDGSLDGVERFAAGEALATALHVIDAAAEIGADRGASGANIDADAPSGGGPGGGGRSGSGTITGLADDARWNVPLVRARFAAEPVVLIAFVRRARGLVVERGTEATLPDIASLRGRRVVPRQRGAGSQVLFERLAAAARLGRDAIELVAPVRTEHDAALAVAEGRADAAFGLPCLARQLGLGFVPLTHERFDLLVGRRAWFEPSLQRFAAFCRSEAFRERADALAGYDASVFGEVRFNGA